MGNWMKIKIIDPTDIKKTTYINVNLDSCKSVVRIFIKGIDTFVFDGGVLIPRSIVSEEIWNKVEKIVNDLPEKTE